VNSSRKEDLKFNRTARKSIVFFAVLMAIVLLTPRVMLLINPKPRIVIIQTKQEAGAQEVFKNAKYAPNFKRKSWEQKSKYSGLKIKTDPNTITASQWQKLGLSEKQASSVLKFKERTKGFKSISDLEKLFVMPKQLLLIIQDSLVFPKNAIQTNSFETSSWSASKLDKKGTNKSKVDINSATEEELMSINGVGPFFAKGIVKRRTQLGGYASLNQLLEVWKMDDEKFQIILPNVKVDPMDIQKININTATAEELKVQAYITWNVANSIVKYRIQHGNYGALQELRKSVLIDAELYEKIKDYLTL
jgi:competence protein ComEA